jgi:hypothetical protein
LIFEAESLEYLSLFLHTALHHYGKRYEVEALIILSPPTHDALHILANAANIWL